MKNILSKIKNNYLLIYVIINLIYILIGSVLKTYGVIKYGTFSYGYIVLLSINILIILILFLKKKYRKNIIDIFLLLIIVFAGISTIFAYSPNKALFGEWMRYEGLFTICYYITLVYVTSYLKKEDRIKIVYAILIFGFIQCIYGICQKLDLFNVKTRIKNNSRWASGFVANRAFFCSLMLICLCYSIGLFIESKDRLKIAIFLILTYIFTIGLLISKAKSCFIALLLIMVLLLIYCIKFKLIKKYIILWVVLIFTGFLMQILNLTPVIEFFSNTTSQVVEVSKGNISDDLGNKRIGLWKETIKLVPDNIITGVGVDNFYNINNGNPIVVGTARYDKAHNEYLQILATMGIFSLISYLCLHFIIIKNGIKNAFKNKEIYLILPVIGYIIQAQFNISVITVAPLFYIGLGLLVYREKKK